MKSRRYEVHLDDLILLTQAEDGEPVSCAVSGPDQSEVVRVDRALVSLLLQAAGAELVIAAASGRDDENNRLAMTLLRQRLGLAGG
jgi:hypothetical protein